MWLESFAWPAVSSVDFLDTLGIENVVGIEHFDRCLLEVVDGGIVEDEAVEVGADDFDDVIAEGVAFLVEFGKVEALADGFQGFGEFRIEKGADLVLGRGAGAADGFGDAEHVGGDVVDSDEEGDLDIGAEVVLADEAVLAGAIDFEAFHGDIHEFGAVDDRVDGHSGEGDLGFAHAGADEGGALFDFLEDTGVKGENTDDDNDDDCDGDADDFGDDGQGLAVLDDGIHAVFLGVREVWESCLGDLGAAFQLMFGSIGRAR